jgi:hypothetical protein
MTPARDSKLLASSQGGQHLPTRSTNRFSKGGFTGLSLGGSIGDTPGGVFICGRDWVLRRTCRIDTSCPTSSKFLKLKIISYTHSFSQLFFFFFFFFFEVSRTKDLESEIETLKKDIQIRDRTIEARDKDLALARKQAKEARAQALESEKTLDRVLINLTEANEAKIALTARVAEVQLEKDSLAADKQALAEKQKEAHARHKKLRKKSHHYKFKSKRLKKQLALVPWLRGLS